MAHTFLFGLDYQQLNWNDYTRFGAAPSLNILQPNYSQLIPLPRLFQNQYQVQDQLGLYTQDQVKFGNFVLVVSGREDWANTSTDNYLADTTTAQRNRAFTWHAGLLYHFDSGLAPYVSYSTSFQPTAGTTAEGTPFKPTTGAQYEAGVKYQPPGWNSLITASIFDLTQQNVLTSDPDPTHPAGSEVQTGQVRSRGAEISAVATINESLSARASFTYLDTRIIQANDGTIGNRFADTPNSFGKIWADYTIKNGSFFAGLGFSAGIRYIGQSYATNANVYKIPDYTLIDAGVHYDFGKLRPDLTGLQLAVNATNLFDKQYVSYCTAAGCRWGLGRTVYATLKYSW